MKDTTELSDELPRYNVQAIKEQGQEFMVSHAAALSAHQALHGALKNCDISQIDPELKALISQVAQVVATKFGAGETSEAFGTHWFEVLKEKVESGEIPKYRGQCTDGSAIDFVHRNYKDYLNTGLLKQNLLRLLDAKLIKAITYECEKKGWRTSAIIPPAREVLKEI